MGSEVSVIMTLSVPKSVLEMPLKVETQHQATAFAYVVHSKI